MSCSCHSCCPEHASVPVVELKDVNFAYQNGTPVIENANLQIMPGESGCIVGPNGGGKSTLLKILLGLLPIDSGSVRIFGKTPEEARRRVGYMPQYHQLDAAFPVSVMEVVLMVRVSKRTLFGFRRHDKEFARSVLDELGIADLEKRSFAGLSGGQRQRVLIARALAGEPDLLLLDEPTANIDPGAGEQFYLILEKLRKRMTVVTVSHDLGFVHRETDLIICVNKQVVIHKPADFTAETANEIYHHNMSLIKHDHSCFCHCEGGSL